jgi:hypothetical protein
MKNLGRFAVLGAALAVSVSLCTTAYADSVHGEVWENASAYPNDLSSTPPVAVGTTFTLSGTGNLFNFISGSSNNLATDPTYTLGGFLQSGGDLLTALAGGTAATGDSINDDVFEFTGTTYLTAGTNNYGITHDDGMYLFLTPLGGGSTITAISSPSPTSADLSQFGVSTTGYYNFEILYAEVNGAPAELSGTLGTLTPPSATPEPSSLMLLGTGLMGLAGMFHRRRRAV